MFFIPYVHYFGKNVPLKKNNKERLDQNFKKAKMLSSQILAIFINIYVSNLWDRSLLAHAHLNEQFVIIGSVN